MYLYHFIPLFLLQFVFFWAASKRTKQAIGNRVKAHLKIPALMTSDCKTHSAAQSFDIYLTEKKKRTVVSVACKVTHPHTFIMWKRFWCGKPILCPRPSPHYHHHQFSNFYSIPSAESPVSSFQYKSWTLLFSWLSIRTISFGEVCAAVY